MQNRKTLKIAVLTHDKGLYEFLQKTIVEYGNRKCIPVSVTHVEQFKDILPDHEEHDMMIVDDNFERRSSVEVSRLIRTRNTKVALVLLSTSPDKVFDSFAVRTHRFFLKPITQTMIFEALDSYQKDLSSYRIIIARIAGGYHSFSSEQIQYVEAHGKNCILHLAGQDVLASNAFGEIVDQLPADYFFKPHRCFLVNMNQIRSFTADSVTLASGVTLPVSRRRKTEFLMVYNLFVRSHMFS